MANEPSHRLPDFFIVGHPKSGTTALYEMLRGHPQVFMPALKEPLFFSGEVNDPRLSHAKNLPHTLDEYMSLFAEARPEQRIGEASPSYLKSHVAAERIAELRPDARIIAILREPASFLRSLHLELLRDHVETETDLKRAIAVEEKLREEGQSSQMQMGLRYSPEHVHYVEQLRRYHDAFGREQVLVLIYDDFRADNAETVRRVLRFLEVDDIHPIEVVEARPAVRVRSPRLYGLVQSLYLGRGRAAGPVKAAIKAVTPRHLRRDGLAAFERRVLFGKPRAPDQELMLELRRRSKDDVIALSEYLNRDFVTLWGYEGID